MKIKITLGTEHGGRFLVLGVEHAALAAQLMAAATVYERDGYYATSGYKVADEGVCITYTSGNELEPTNEQTKKAQEEARQANSRWSEQYHKANELEQQVATLQAKLDELRRATTCTAAATGEDIEPASETASDEEE